MRKSMVGFTYVTSPASFFNLEEPNLIFLRPWSLLLGCWNWGWKSDFDLLIFFSVFLLLLNWKLFESVLDIVFVSIRRRNIQGHQEVWFECNSCDGFGVVMFVLTAINLFVKSFVWEISDGQCCHVTVMAPP